MNIKLTLNEPKFPRTCDMLYSLTAKRVLAKYQLWEETQIKQGFKTRDIDFPSSQHTRKILGLIINNSPKNSKDNPFLITPNIVEAFVLSNNFDAKDLDEYEIKQQIIEKTWKFPYAHTLFWGTIDEIEEYLEDIFVSLLLDMKNYPNYFKHWNSFNLNNENEYREFYKENIINIPENLNMLFDLFLAFTYNDDEFIRKFIDKKGILEIKKYKVTKDIKESKNWKILEDKLNQEDCLTFYELPKKIKLFAEEGILSLIDHIRLSLLFEESSKQDENIGTAIPENIKERLLKIKNSTIS